MRRITLLLLVFGLSACATSPIPPISAGSVRAQRIYDGVTFTLDSPANPRINQTQRLRVTLLDAEGQLIDGANVYFDLSMDMICLSGSRPVARAVGQGRYEVDVVYVMAGDWRIQTFAEINDRTWQVTFPLVVAE